MSAFDVYVIFQTAEIRWVFLALAIFTACLGAVHFFVAEDHPLDAPSEKLKAMQLRGLRRILLAGLLVIMCFIVPSTRTMLMVYTLPKVATKERIEATMKVVDKALKFMNYTLDNRQSSKGDKHDRLGNVSHFSGHQF